MLGQFNEHLHNPKAGFFKVNMAVYIQENNLFYVCGFITSRTILHHFQKAQLDNCKYLRWRLFQ